MLTSWWQAWWWQATRWLHDDGKHIDDRFVDDKQINTMWIGKQSILSFNITFTQIYWFLSNFNYFFLNWFEIQLVIRRRVGRLWQATRTRITGFPCFPFLPFSSLCISFSSSPWRKVLRGGRWGEWLHLRDGRLLQQVQGVSVQSKGSYRSRKRNPIQSVEGHIRDEFLVPFKCISECRRQNKNVQVAWFEGGG